MNFFNNLITRLEDKYETDYLYKVILLSFFSIANILFSFVISFMQFIQNEYIYGSIFFALSLFSFVFLKKINTKDKYLIIKNLLIILIIISIITYITISDFGYYSLFWTFLFPFILVYLFDLKRGTLLSFLLILAIVISNLVFMIYVENEIIEIKLLKKISYILPYLLLTFIIYFNEIINIYKEKQYETNSIKNQKKTIIKDELITKISYQIRTPLNNILGLKNLLEQTHITEYQKDILNSIEASIGNLNHVIEQIDSVSDAKINFEKNNFSSFNIKNAISRTVDFYQHNYQNIDIKFLFSNEIPEKLYGNPVAVKQIFINLIELSINQHNTKTRIEIEANIRCEIEGLVTCNFLFKIINNNSLKQLIESDKLLEYSIVKSSVDKMSGKIKVVEKENSTLFDFFLEFETSSEMISYQSFNENKFIYQKNEEKGILLQDANILVVEDNEINQKVVELSLTKHVKNLDFANNGKEALELYGKNKYNLIIMDIQMPVMDGIRTTKKIREAEVATKTHTPIIAITANALVHDRTACLEAGMDDYIAKPYKIQDVIEKIENLLSNENKIV